MKEKQNVILINIKNILIEVKYRDAAPIADDDAIIENNVSKMEYLQEENNRLAAEYKVEKQRNIWYRFCMEKVFECTSILFSYPIERLKSICSKFIESTKDEHNKVDLEDESSDSNNSEIVEDKEKEKIFESEKVL